MNGMKRFSTKDAARILGVNEDQIRTYARLGEIVPLRGPGGRLEFEFPHLLLLKTTKGLLEAGVPAEPPDDPVPGRRLGQDDARVRAVHPQRAGAADGQEEGVDHYRK